MLLIDTNLNIQDTLNLVGLVSNDNSIYLYNGGGYIGDTIITANGLNIARYEPYPLNIFKNPTTCQIWNDGSVGVNPSLGFPPYSFYWSTGDTTAYVDQLSIGTYEVTVTDSIGCIITDSVEVDLGVPPADNMLTEICYVSVDPISGYNKIRVKPTSNSFVSNYIIYKASASVYYPLDTLDANTLTYIDSTSNPAVQANRYKVSAIDVCGNVSDTSAITKQYI